MSKEAAQHEFGLDNKLRTVGLFPGSRKREIDSLLSVMLDSGRLLQERFPDLQFILPLASSVDRENVDQKISASGLTVKVVEGKNYDVMQTCDAIIAASGTVTMEIALFGIPMVIIYKASPLTFAIGIRLLNVDHVGICNIVAGERIVPELLQDDAEPLKIANEVARILADSEYATAIRHKLLRIRSLLGNSGASGRVARLAIDIMEQGKDI